MDKGGKYLIIGFLILLFAIPVILALDSRNKKSYDEGTRTITIKNVLGSKTIAEIKLLSEPVVNVIRGKDRKVAEFEINNFYNNYPSAFEKMEFYDLKRNNREFLRDFRYKFCNEYEVDKYEYACSESIEKYENGSAIVTCENKLVGLNKKCNWLEINHLADLPSGKIRIGLFTDVKAGESVEWIPSLFGVRIDEWASWNESFSEGLIFYHNFSSQQDSIGNYDLETNMGTPIFQTAGCLIDGCGNTTDIDGWNVTGTNNDGFDVGVTPNKSIVLWFKPSHVSSGQKWLAKQRTGPTGLEISSSHGNPQKIYISAGTGLGITGDVLLAGSWNFHAITCNVTSCEYYLDGIYQFQGAGDDVAPEQFITVGWGGASFVSAYESHGLFDELAFWNRTLTASEIFDLYNGGSGLTYVPIILDTTPPETTIPDIIPTYPKTTDNLQCYATLSDDKQENLTAYWTWYKNNISYLSGSKNVTNGTYSLITTLSAENTTKGEQWICEVEPFDGSNYGNASNSTSVTILNSAPNHTAPLLTTPSGKNFHYENLTCYNQSTYDADNDKVVNIYNWYKNSQPFSVLNLPFEINADDYSGYGNDGIIYGTAWEVSKTTGKVGKAIEFDGVDDYVSVPYSNSLATDNEMTVETWIKFNSVSNGRFVTKSYYRGWLLGYHNNKFYFGGHILGDTWRYVEYSTTPTINTWYHVVGSLKDNVLKIYIDGVKKAEYNVVAGFEPEAYQVEIANSIRWEDPFNGIIDEVKVYPYALTPEQIKQRYDETKDGLTSSSKIVSQETSAGDNWMCQVTPNDAEEDGVTLNSSTAEIYYNITFNVTSGEDGSQISNFNINCNNSFSASGVNSPYEAGFLPGSYECTFEKIDYYDGTKIFTADDDKTVNVRLSRRRELTIEEHTWLEAIYNCLYEGDCKALDLLEEINETTTKVWDQLKRTDQSVVINETVTSYEVSDTSNLSVEYTVYVPIKAGYSIGDFLPIRLAYWFLDENNESCYNQGDKPTGVEKPYCYPLIAETLGPMGGQVNFTVELRPSLPEGTYTIIRDIEIDPAGNWIKYGQELIGQVEILDGVSDSWIGLTKNEGSSGSESLDSGSDEQETDEEIETEETTQSSKPGITGAVIGRVSGWQMVAVTGIIAGLFLALIICQTIIRIKKKVISIFFLFSFVIIIVIKYCVVRGALCQI